MVQINLLPWREQARKAKKFRFMVISSIAVGMTIFLAVLTHVFIKSLINSQQQINNYLQAEVTTEEATLAEINKEKQKYNLIASDLHFLFSLRHKSYKAVRLLDALTRVVPDAVLLVKITRDGDKITLAGRAQSNLQVTLLMENLVKSKVFNQPVLSEISAQKNTSANEIRTFQLTVTQQE